MKNSLTHAMLRLLTSIGIGILPACDDDSAKLAQGVIQFSVSVQKVVEGQEAIILLTLDKPAPNHESVKLTLEGNAVYNQHYLTSPAVDDHSVVVNIYKGRKTGMLKIKPLENKKFEGSRLIIFELSDPTEGLRLGQITMLTLVIADDEAPSVANFAARSATLNEKEQDGIVADILFSTPANGEGSLTVTLQEGQAVHEANFTVDRELTNNSFSFNVTRDSPGVSFKVFPVDNDQFTGNFILAFTITDISGVLQKGESLIYSLALVDDEAPSVARFAQLSGTMDESDDDGIMVDISLSSPVKGDGTLGIAIASQHSTYGTGFTTIPELQDGRMTLNLTHGQTGASFTVFPVNDNLFKGDQVLSLSINEASGVAWKASDSLTYKLTIVDDEGP